LHLILWEPSKSQSRVPPTRGKKNTVNSKQIGQKETTKKATNTMHNHDNECPEAVVIPLGLAFEGRIGRGAALLGPFC